MFCENVHRSISNEEKKEIEGYKIHNICICIHYKKMSVQKSPEKQMHTDRKKLAKTDTIQIEEQANSSNAYTFNGQPINNSTEEEQVCICE
jgi:hypothetical protein